MRLLNNTTYTPTLALAFVEALKALDVAPTHSAGEPKRLHRDRSTFTSISCASASIYKSERIEKLEHRRKNRCDGEDDELLCALPVNSS